MGMNERSGARALSLSHSVSFNILLLPVPKGLSVQILGKFAHYPNLSI